MGRFMSIFWLYGLLFYGLIAYRDNFRWDKCGPYIRNWVYVKANFTWLKTHLAHSASPVSQPQSGSSQRPAANGRYPLRRQYAMTPRDHRSHLQG